MSFRSGFFNSNNHDKQYYATDISKLFNSLINPGVFANVGDKFIARAGEGMQVIIPSGMAWFNSTWTTNDSDVVINIDEAPYVAQYSRIDGIFLKVYPVDDIATRENSAYYMKGTETSATPEKPVPTATDGELYIPICYITVANGTTSITASMIENVVGTEACPFITGILEVAQVSELLVQWQAQWNEWLIARKAQAEVDINEWTAADTTMWNNWFQSVKDDLGSIDIGNLKNKVDELTNLYVQDQVLYLPNTGASVTADGTIVLGNDPGEPAIDGGNVQHVRVGNALYDLVPSNSTSKSSFASTSIELALKNLIDSFVSDGTYTGRFKATNTPNKWFSYQIDLFDTVASGYIVNTVDPEESYTVRYRSQTDEQAIISSIGGAIKQLADNMSVVGSITAYAGNTAPDGYLMCDGSAISRTEYARLFEVIGTTYGSGDGSTTFNIPDCRESALVGIGTRGSGVATHDTYTLGQFKDDQLQSHTHNFTAKFNESGGTYVASAQQVWYNDRTKSTTANSGRSGTVTRGKRLGVNYIIKY